MPKPIQILYIEKDDLEQDGLSQLIRRDLLNYFTEDEFQILMATTIEAARNVLQENQIQLMLIDIHLSESSDDKTGIAFIKDPLCLEIPKIAIVDHEEDPDLPALQQKELLVIHTWVKDKLEELEECIEAIRNQLLL